MTLKNKEGFFVSAAQGNISVLPEKRTWTLHFRGVENTTVKVQAEGLNVAAEQSYDAAACTLTVRTAEIPVTSALEVQFEEGLLTAENHMTQFVYEILERAQIAYDLKEAVLKTVEELGKKAVPALFAMELDEALLCAVTEVLTAC